MPLYIPRSLHRLLGERAADVGTTRTALILTAVNEHHRELQPGLTPPPASSGNEDLFDIPQNRPEREPSVETTIRVTDRQLEAIDSLVTRLETNRSALIAAVLRLHLT